ncbi:glycosyltransferase family 2 protein [Salmonella enterica]|nr:glycosyltransferase family 2 protein [Salmonella enterica]EIG1434218.1 glycosyltransferase family 2 protein [Salmonella enterica]EIG1439173.1 glycosyltransferase family 2 protein [Salmonella enterica]
MKKNFRYFLHTLELLKFSVLSFKYGKQLYLKLDRTDIISNDDIILFCTLRNEAIRLPFFLNYYRELGVNHFIFVDNNSNDNFDEIANKQPDVTVFTTKGDYKKSNFGMHWLNYLLRKYGCGKWCLICDPDEFLVFSLKGKKSIKELTDYLDTAGRHFFFTIMIDMYSDKNLNDTKYVIGENPLDICYFFDDDGYFFNENEKMNSLWVQGGPRMRTLFKEKPYNSPALNKTPLVKWKWYYNYISSTHTLLPRRLNAGFRYSLTGALLHFKFMSLLAEKVEEELYRKQHYGNSEEYKEYQRILDDSLYSDGISKQFCSVQDLEESGLVTNREWI